MHGALIGMPLTSQGRPILHLAPIRLLMLVWHDLGFRERGVNGRNSSLSDSWTGS